MSDWQLAPDVLEKISRKRLIFTVTTGRSGTNYMTNMLSYVSGICSRHEPNPPLHEVLREVQADTNKAYDFLVNEKLPVIADEKEAIYIETSHLMCKGFIEPLLDIGVLADLIILRREPRAVAKSMYQLDHIPARSSVGKKFLLQPDDPDVLPLPEWEALHDYQLAFWYTLEIERRAQKYKALYLDAGAKVVETTLDEFSTITGYYRFLRELKLPFPPAINMLKHLKSHIRRVNNKDDLKQERQVADIETLEAEVLERIPYNPLEKLQV